MSHLNVTRQKCDVQAGRQYDPLRVRLNMPSNLRTPSV